MIIEIWEFARTVWNTEWWYVPWLNLMLTCLPQISSVFTSPGPNYGFIFVLQVPNSQATKLREKYTVIPCFHRIVIASCTENILPGLARYLFQNNPEILELHSLVPSSFSTDTMHVFLLFLSKCWFPLQLKFHLPQPQDLFLFLHLSVVSSSCWLVWAWDFMGISSFLAAFWNSPYFFCVPNSHI